jgi:hypothetical protein
VTTVLTVPGTLGHTTVTDCARHVPGTVRLCVCAPPYRGGTLSQAHSHSELGRHADLGTLDWNRGSRGQPATAAAPIPESSPRAAVRDCRRCLGIHSTGDAQRTPDPCRRSQIAADSVLSSAQVGQPGGSDSGGTIAAPRASMPAFLLPRAVRRAGMRALRRRRSRVATGSATCENDPRSQRGCPRVAQRDAADRQCRRCGALPLLPVAREPDPPRAWTTAPRSQVIVLKRGGLALRVSGAPTGPESSGERNASYASRGGLR